MLRLVCYIIALIFLLGVNAFAKGHDPRFGRYKVIRSNGQKLTGWKWNGQRSGRWILRYSTKQPRRIVKYSRGILDGLYEQYYFTGGKKVSGHYRKGGEEGEWNWWDREHHLIAVKHYHAGKLHGEYREYFPNGRLYKSGSYSDGREEGVWYEYAYGGGIRDSAFYIDGRKHGEEKPLNSNTADRKIYYTNGRTDSIYESNFAGILEKFKLSQRIIYGDSGRMHYTNYYPDGKMKEDFHMRNGLMQGEWRSWHENGKPNVIKQYRDWKANGSERRYNPGGQLVYEYHFRDNQPEGVCRLWYDNGKLYTEESYTNGVPDGRFHIWMPDGKQYQERLFRKGLLMHLKQWDSSGVLILEEDRLTGRLTEWYKDGRLHKAYFFKVIPDGSMNTEEIYDSSLDARNGISIAYYPDGRPMSKSIYRNGNYTGTWQNWDNRGKLISETQYKNDSNYSIYRYSVNGHKRLVSKVRNNQIVYSLHKVESVPVEEDVMVEEPQFIDEHVHIYCEYPDTIVIWPGKPEGNYPENAEEEEMTGTYSFALTPNNGEYAQYLYIKASLTTYTGNPELIRYAQGKAERMYCKLYTAKDWRTKPVIVTIKYQMQEPAVVRH